MIFKYIRTENAETVCWIISSECLLNSNQQQQEPWWRWTWTSPPMCMIKIVLLVNSDNRLLLSNEMIRLTFDWKAGTHANLAKNVYSLATSENKHTSRLCYSMARWWKNKQVFPLLFSAKCLRDIQSALRFAVHRLMVKPRTGGVDNTFRLTTESMRWEEHESRLIVQSPEIEVDSLFSVSASK